MAINTALAIRQGVSEREKHEIEFLHKCIDNYMRNAIAFKYPDEEVANILTRYDYQLQDLWHFPQNKDYHTLCRIYLFKKMWAFRKFMCQDTKEFFIIPFEVRETDFYSIGNGFLDVGRYAGDTGYYRVGGNIIEITEG